MSKPKLTNADFCEAAKRLRCEVAAIKAVSEVESRGSGFYDDGFPTILFERHVFYKYCNRENRAEWSKTYPHICNRSPGGYGATGQNQKNKFNLAFSLDPIAAMKSCSWGKFQIMGFNFAMCGFDSVGDFVDAMKRSEGEHLLAFVGFVKSAGLADELRNRQWARFASGYNGAGYRKNKYDDKMAAAYQKFSKENIDCSKVSAAVPPSSQTQAGQSAQTEKVTGTTSTQIGAIPQADSSTEQPPTEQNQTGEIEQTVSQTVETEGKTVETTVSETKSTFEPKNIPAFIPRFGKQWLLGLIPGAGFLSTIGGYVAGLPQWIVFVLGAITGIALWKFLELVIKHHEKVIEFISKCYQMVADPEMNNLIPTNASSFVGMRSSEIENALAAKDKNLQDNG